jgi:hypothetical protein
MGAAGSIALATEGKSKDTTLTRTKAVTVLLKICAFEELFINYC